ncbi:hypothetical protein [Bacillus massiliigorillae]|uniref:hypothetical protein n=1 Tax=Bacillus massiliigorillae TaxID=1243664 RepID=UPI00039AF540|nr:hypothetical protein [Bacillus massiliigorillae]
MTKKNVYISILLVLVIGGCFVGLYYWKIDPMKVQTENKRAELQNEEEYLQTIQGINSPTSKEINLGTTVELQKKLPVKPLVQQLVLDLQKAEVVSNSMIKNISIVEEEASDETKEEKNLNSKDYNNFNLQEEADENDKGTEEEKKVDTEAVLSGLKTVTMTLSVQSPTYAELQMFLSSIESMKRIMKVNTLTFTGEEELISIEQTRKPLDYSVVITAYYAPILEDLQKDLPQMEASKPSEKTNPFSTSPSTTIE